MQNAPPHLLTLSSRSPSSSGTTPPMATCSGPLCASHRAARPSQWSATVSATLTTSARAHGARCQRRSLSRCGAPRRPAGAQGAHCDGSGGVVRMCGLVKGDCSTQLTYIHASGAWSERTRARTRCLQRACCLLDARVSLAHAPPGGLRRHLPHAHGVHPAVDPGPAKAGHSFAAAGDPRHQQLW